MRRCSHGLDAFRGTGAELDRPYYLALLAEAYGKGRLRGAAPLAEALAMVHSNGERCWEAELYRLKGELLLILSPTTKRRRRPVSVRPSTSLAVSRPNRWSCGRR